MEERLKEIVVHAYKTVPFYRKIAEINKIDIDKIDIDKDFDKLPLIDKDMVQNAQLGMLSDKYNHYPFNQEIEIRKTSGSTGKFMKIYWHNQDDRNSLMELWWIRKKYYNIFPNDRLCYFYTTDYQNNKLVEEKDEKLSLLKNQLGLYKNRLNSKRLRETYERIYEYDPYWMILQPSTAILLAECVTQYKLPKLKSLRYIELTGEVLFDSCREMIERVFECKINNQYGSVETNCIASYMGGKELYCNRSNVFVEIVKQGQNVKDGEEGDIYVTSLTNKAMPFVRYKIGDSGRLYHIVNQETGLVEQKIELIQGRISDFVIDCNGEKIPAYVFVHAIEHISQEIGTVINQFQIIQNNIGDFTVRLAIKSSYIGWKSTIAELFLKYIDQPSLKNANYRFEFSQYLFPQESTGKLAFFYNQVYKKEDENGSI